MEDGATLPILYDALLPELPVEKEQIDRKFELYFKNTGSARKDFLRKKAATLDRHMHSRERIWLIAENIIQHYQSKIYPGGFKAMVVCHSREAAIAYHQAFNELEEEGVHDFKIQTIITLDKKKDPEAFLRLAVDPFDIKKAVEDFKLPFGDESQRAKSGRKGRKMYDNTAITIVCDMLLTGYDVPVVQVMCLDKLLVEHSLLQAIARVNRTRAGKNAGFIIDYCGITKHLSRALAMFSEDLSPGEVMENTGEEVNRLEQRYRQLVAFFDSIKEDPFTQRDMYIDQAVLYLEPEDLRDQFKILLRNFNKSMDILLPSPEAVQYEYQFRLYNAISAQAANLYVDDSLKISEEESRKIRKLIDEHLRADGISYLLEEPVSIIDREKFDEEIKKTFSIKSRTLKRLNRIKHTIKINLEKNPGLYIPLSQRLEELIKLWKESRIQQLELFKELDEIENPIHDETRQAWRLGFTSGVQFAVYKVLETLPDVAPKDLTLAIFQSLAGEFEIDNWRNKSQVKKTMRRKIKEAMAAGVPKEQRDNLAHTVLDVIINNPSVTER